MSKDAGFTSKHLEDRVNKLLKRFEEQKGIINAYIKREREWKKDKVLHKKNHDLDARPPGSQLGPGNIPFLIRCLIEN